MYYWRRKTYTYAYKYRYASGGYMDSCPSHLTQRSIRKIEITLRSKDPVLSEIARRLCRPPLPSKKTAAAVKEDAMAAPDLEEPHRMKL
jgi:hypothetical protein